MAFVLRISSSGGPVREQALQLGETSVGRDPINTLILTGRGVSRRHAKLLLQGDRLTVVDLGSTYGTKVNEMPTLRREVRPGDRITIGIHEMEVQRPMGLEPLDAPALIEPSGTYHPDEITHDPRAQRAEQLMRKASTLQLDSGSVQFLDDNEQADAEVISAAEGPILEAVRRLGTGTHPAIGTGNYPALGEHVEGPVTIPPRTADYHALLLMYKVSQLLGEAPDLEGFLASVCDLVMEEVRANTVVVLTGSTEQDLAPQAIRHRGALDPGEVPVSRGILELVLRTRSSVISGDALHDDRIKAGQSLALYNIRAVVAAPLMLHGRVRGVLYLNRAGPIPFSKAEGELVGALASLMASGMERAELKDHVSAEKQRRKGLERFHPPDVIDQLDAGREGGHLREHHATALVCNLVGFGELARRISPQELAQVLGDYYELLYEKVFGNGGSLVKLHDGWALALFGMHGSVDRDAVWAMEAARQLGDEFTALSVLWPCSELLHLACAIDSGTLVAGVVGSAERLEYLALGEPISASSELVQREEGNALLITEDAWDTLPQQRFDVDPVEPLGERAVFRLEL